MLRSVFPAESSVVAEVQPSPNHGERRDGMRPDMILLHYTGMIDAMVALDRLCGVGSEVSAHYLAFEDGRVVQMVPEARPQGRCGREIPLADAVGFGRRPLGPARAGLGRRPYAGAGRQWRSGVV